MNLINDKQLTTANIENFKRFDQLGSTLNTNLSGFHEGINNGGPNFLPTCKLSKKCPIIEKENIKLTKEKLDAYLLGAIGYCILAKLLAYYMKALMQIQHVKVIMCL